MLYQECRELSEKVIVLETELNWLKQEQMEKEKENLVLRQEPQDTEEADERDALLWTENKKLKKENSKDELPLLVSRQSDFLLTPPTNRTLDCLEEQINAPGEPRVGIPSNLMSDIDFEWNQETRGSECNMPNHGKITGRANRSWSDVGPLQWDNRRNSDCARRFKSMTQVEQETELNDMKSLYQSICGKYNKIQEAEDSTDEKTSHTGSSGNLAIESSESSDGAAQEIGHKNRRTFMSCDPEDEQSLVILNSSAT